MSASHVARALAVAAYRPGEAARGDAVLARIAGPDAVAARTLLAAMHGPDGAALVHRVRSELAAPRPAHWRRAHVSWLDERFAGEGAAVRAAACEGDTPPARYLARAFLGGLVPMPDPAAPARGVLALVALDPDVLARTFVLLGRRQFAYALTGGPRQELAELATRLAWGKELVAEIAAIGRLGEQADRRLGRRTSAALRITGLRITAAMDPARAGMRALAPAVARVPDLVEQLAQRLARPVGALARIELRHVLLVDGPDDTEVSQAIARASVGGP